MSTLEPEPQPEDAEDWMMERLATPAPDPQQMAEMAAKLPVPDRPVDLAEQGIKPEPSREHLSTGFTPCDRCGARAANVVALANGGELVFCQHHTDKYRAALSAGGATIEHMVQTDREGSDG